MEKKDNILKQLPLSEEEIEIFEGYIKGLGNKQGIHLSYIKNQLVPEFDEELKMEMQSTVKATAVFVTDSGEPIIGKTDDGDSIFFRGFTIDLLKIDNGIKVFYQVVPKFDGKVRYAHHRYIDDMEVTMKWFIEYSLYDIYWDYIIGSVEYYLTPKRLTPAQERKVIEFWNENNIK